MTASPNALTTADALWRHLAEHQPAVAAALAMQTRALPDDWSQRLLGVARPHAALDLAPTDGLHLEIAPYDASDPESCEPCADNGDLCRWHAGFTAGYDALHGPLAEAVRRDPEVTVKEALRRLAEREEAAMRGEPVPAVEPLPDGAEERGTVPAPGEGASLFPGTLLVAVGPSASGKSTYANTAPVDVVVCLDSIRAEITGDAGDQSATPAAVARQNALLEEYLSAGKSVFLDSTNVEPRVRTELVERARQYGRPIIAVRFLTDIDTCLARNAERPSKRRVPDETLRWQHDRAREATPEILRAEGFTAVHHIEPAPTATMSKDTIAPERITDAVTMLRKAQEGDEEAHEGLAEFFPEYEGLVMQTDHTRYLEAAAGAGMVATHLLVMQYGKGVWGASVDTYSADFGLPLASVNLGDYPSRTEAIREAVTAATDNGWMLAPEQDWTDYDCGGGEIHIPIHARPSTPTL
ncbi:ATP-binding protein [Streptomyces sp. NPDC006863]|uniref:ATP-binding protein n=1 Tax=Streptomyces sp. NPDC006863 TaxID=3154779 RepID=UPI003400FFEF